jgi:hypothetical protein
MSRIFVTARALSSQLADGGWDESLLPLQFQVTRDRLARAAEAHAAFAAQNAHAVIVDDEVMDRRAMRPKGAWWRVPFGW